MEVKNFGFFTLISGNVFGVVGKYQHCSVLGIFHTWIPLCYKISLPNCDDIGGCHERGLCIGKNSCLCLPGSKTDERCSANILAFKRFDFFGLLPSGMENISILEVIVFIILSLYVTGMVRQNVYQQLTASWDDCVVRLHIWRFCSAQFIHSNLLHMIYNLYSFYTCAPIMYSLVGESAFIKLFLLGGGFGIIFELLFRRVSGLPDRRVAGMSPFLCCLKTFFILISPKSRQHPLRELARAASSHLVAEYIFVGSQASLTAPLSGLLSGYFLYRAMGS